MQGEQFLSELDKFRGAANLAAPRQSDQEIAQRVRAWLAALGYPSVNVEVLAGPVPSPPAAPIPVDAPLLDAFRAEVLAALAGAWTVPFQEYFLPGIVPTKETTLQRDLYRFDDVGTSLVRAHNLRPDVVERSAQAGRVVEVVLRSLFQPSDLASVIDIEIAYLATDLLPPPPNVHSLSLTINGSSIEVLSVASLSSLEAALREQRASVSRFQKTRHLFTAAVEAGLMAFAIRGETLVCVPRPEIPLQDGFVHCEAGTPVRWADGRSSWFWNNIEVPDWVILNPERITPAEIASKDDTRVQLAMIERIGWENFVHQVDANVVDDDARWGRLEHWREHLWVRVWNSTPDPDGTRRQFILPVDPLLRPLPRPGVTGLGLPQSYTALNAVASTFGMTGEQYAHLTAES